MGHAEQPLQVSCRCVGAEAFGAAGMALEVVNAGRHDELEGDAPSHRRPAPEQAQGCATNCAPAVSFAGREPRRRSDEERAEQAWEPGGADDAACSPPLEARGGGPRCVPRVLPDDPWHMPIPGHDWDASEGMADGRSAWSAGAGIGSSRQAVGSAHAHMGAPPALVSVRPPTTEAMADTCEYGAVLSRGSQTIIYVEQQICTEGAPPRRPPADPAMVDRFVAGYRFAEPAGDRPRALRARKLRLVPRMPGRGLATRS